jgi:hypothetical protein
MPTFGVMDRTITSDDMGDLRFVKAWAAAHDDVYHAHVGSQRVVVGVDLGKDRTPIAVERRSGDLHGDLDAALHSARTTEGSTR